MVQKIRIFCVQMSISSIHMQQSQSMTVTNQNMSSNPQHQQLVNNASSASNNQNSAALSSFNAQTADFSLEFLDNLQTSDSTAFTDQELLSSFDSDSGFNLDF